MDQQVSVYAGKQLNPQARRLWQTGRGFLALTIILLALTACSLLNREPTRGDAAELQGQAIVTCNATCAERGQCGTTPEGGQVVLGGRGWPVVENQDIRFPAGVPVNILESRQEVVETIATLEQFSLWFYHVNQPEQLLDGWVAGWCLATP